MKIRIENQQHQHKINDWDSCNDLFEKAELLRKFVSEHLPHLDYRQFVYSLLGSVKPNMDNEIGTHKSITAAINQWQLPIATTNYDMLLENCLGRVYSKCENVNLNNADPFVYHIHGLMHDASEIVLQENAESYDVFEKGMLELLDYRNGSRSIIFIGCQDGAVDHHFSCLFRTDNVSSQNFILLKQPDHEKLLSKDAYLTAVASSKLCPIIYGAKNEELISFLWKISAEMEYFSSKTIYCPSLSLHKKIEWDPVSSSFRTVFQDGPN